MIDSKHAWIQAGYTLFGLQGEKGLKVEVLAQKVGISKSSFYHHFVDLDGFVEQLMAFHLSQCRVLAEKERAAESIDPALIDILVAHREDILFSRQLRFNQSSELYRQTLEQSNRIIGKDFIQLWAKELPAQFSIAQLEGIFELALENFYLQVHPGNLHADWLRGYFQHLQGLLHRFA